MNYKETFIRLYKELESATNELEMIQNQNPYETSHEFDKMLFVNGEKIYINSPVELSKYEITPELIEANAESTIIMYWMELNMAIKRRDEISKMIASMKYISDEAYDAWKEVINKKG